MPDAVAAARRAGFDAVECHFPYDTPPHDLRAAGLPVIGLNTPPGDRAAGEFGLAAVPGRMAAARAGIAQAVDYAVAAGAGAVHVMAGYPRGAAGAEEAFRANLAHACDLAAGHGLTVLIEPLNPHDAPGYHLADLDHALDTIAAVDRANLRLMFDCYHIARIHGDVEPAFARARHVVGHVQFAGVPDRGEPDTGTVDYRALLPAMGWHGPFGAEYRPRGGDTLAGLGWLGAFRALA